MRAILGLAVALALASAPPAAAAQAAGPAGEPARAASGEEMRRPSPPLRGLGEAAGAIALSVVTVPLRLAATVALTPAYHLLLLTGPEEGRRRADELAEKYLLGDYAVRPEHIRGERRYRFFGLTPP